MITLGTRMRPVAAVLATAALNVGCWSWCQGDRAALVAGPDRAGLPVLITGLAAVLLQVALAWLLLLTVLVALEPLAGRDLTSYAGCPAGLRRTLLACCGAAAVGVLAVPAQATPVAPAQVANGSPVRTTPILADPMPGDRSPSTVLEGLPLPDRTLGGLDARVPGGRSVLVRPGDTLWAIAAAHLPAGAGADHVARAWRVLYDSNRTLIGPDPDLITPGIRLRLPPTPQQEDDR
jgi:hypothetical protein